MLIDTHIHTKRCHHAEGDLEDYVQEAIKKNFGVISFSEHAPLDSDPNKRLSLEESKEYIRDIEKLKLKYADKIKILCGFEIDYIGGSEDKIKNFIKECPADFYLGSIHFIPFDGKIYTIWDYETISKNKSLQKEYFNLMTKAIRSKLFDSISHPDLILRSGVNEDELENEFVKIFEELSKNQVGYELNCSGLFKTRYNKDKADMEEGGFFSKKYLLLASEQGVFFTIGSDAHRINEFGQGIKEMMDYSFENNLRIYYVNKKLKIKIK